MIDRIIAFLASAAFKEFFSSLFGYLANKKALRDAEENGFTKAHEIELENILKDNLKANQLQEKIKDAQAPPTIDALNDWLRDKRAPK